MSATPHPRLPLMPRGAPVCTEGHCVTCADEGLPMRVARVGDAGLAVCVDDNGGETEVMTGIVGTVAVDDVLLVHAGTALVRLGVEALS